MSLNKVKEFIMNEASSLQQNNRSGNQFNMPREYDLVAKVDKIQVAPNTDDVMKIMTGGRQPEIKIKQNRTEENKEAKEIKEIEEAIQIKISDTSQMQFEIIVPKSLMPERV
jgi:hypothetical protein